MRVIVFPPDEDGGRAVHVDGVRVGRAWCPEDVAELAGAGEVEWRGGGPDQWVH